MVHSAPDERRRTIVNPSQFTPISNGARRSKRKLHATGDVPFVHQRANFALR
jgi:hypothetical protein